MPHHTKQIDAYLGRVMATTHNKICYYPCMNKDLDGMRQCNIPGKNTLDTRGMKIGTNLEVAKNKERSPSRR